MTTDLSAGKARVTRGHCYLLLAASVMTCLQVTMGGVVCVTASAAGCPDWPGCYGRIIPPPQVNAIIEYLHRFVAALTSPLILAAAVVSWRQARSIRWLSRPPALALVFLLAVIVFGALTVLRGLPPVLAAIDLGSALVVLALMLLATVVAFARQARPDLPDQPGGGGFARLSLAALGAVFLVYVGGILVAGKGSLTRCLSWPMWRLIPGDLAGWPQIVRLALALVSALLIAAVVVQAWRTQRRQPALLRMATLVGLLFLVEMAAGAAMLAGGSNVFLLVLYVAAAAALWALLVVLVVLAELGPAGQPYRRAFERPAPRRRPRSGTTGAVPPAAQP